VSCSPDAPLKETAAEAPLVAPLTETAAVGSSAPGAQREGRAQAEKKPAAGAVGAPRGVAADTRTGGEVAATEKQEAAAGKQDPKNGALAGPKNGAQTANARQREKNQA
jgi:hypothetical protein